MFIEAIILGMIIGLITKRRISNLFSIEIKGWHFIILAVLIQYSPVVLKSFDFISFDYNYFTLTGNIIILIIVLINREIKSSLVIFLGGLINTIAFYINGLKIPLLESVASNQMIELIRNGKIINYKLVSELTSWKLYLGKIVKVPEIYPFARPLSIGDMIIMLGLVLLIVREMDKTYFKNNGAMLRFPYR